jgi:hypothetical protein
VTGEPSAERGPAVNEDDETRPKRAASEIADLVATRVRDAIDEAERSAQVLKTQALDDASARRGAVRDKATEALARIDQIERQLKDILQDMRGEAAQIAKIAEAPSGGTDDRERYAHRFARGDESTWRSRATPGEPQQSGTVADQEPDRPGAEDRAAAEQPAERFEWREPAGAEPEDTQSPDDAMRQDERTGDQPPPTPAAPLDAPTVEASSAPDEHAEPAPDDFAARPTHEGEPMILAGEETDEQEESGAEHPHDAARRRRPGLFRHRRDE